MKAYSVDLRKKIVAAHHEQKLSIRATAAIFSVSKSLVQKLVKQQKIEGNLVFLDETGVLLGLKRTHARSERGTRA